MKRKKKFDVEQAHALVRLLQLKIYLAKLEWRQFQEQLRKVEEEIKNN